MNSKIYEICFATYLDPKETMILIWEFLEQLHKMTCLLINKINENG